VIQRKVTSGYRAIDTARLTGSTPFGTILKTVPA